MSPPVLTGSENMHSSWIARFVNWRFLSVALILAVGAIVYYPTLAIGFWTDDYRLIEVAGRSSFWEYLSIHLDPNPNVFIYFRPIQGLQWWIGYALFGGDAFWFHVIQVGLHLTNIVLFFDAVVRLTNRSRLALIAALIYSTLSTYSLAVFWVSVNDPLMSFFYLLAIKKWIDYLDKPNPRELLFTLVTFLCALLSKETGITLPVILFLIDHWLVHKPLSLAQAIKRYSLFFIGALIYGLIQAAILLLLLSSPSPDYYGSRIDILATALSHLKTLSFPWVADSSIGSAWISIVLGFGIYAVIKRKWHIVFLFVVTALPMLPVLLQFQYLAEAQRYTYLSLMGSAVGVAAVIEEACALLSYGLLRRVALTMIPLGLTLVILSGSVTIAEGAVNFAGDTRQLRLQFQPIFRQNSHFEPKTLLYFIDLPIDPTVPSGLFFLRYGADVHIATSSEPDVIDLQSFSSAFMYYQDDDQNWHKLAWDIRAVANETPELPVHFGQSIALEKIQISSNQLQPGDALGLLLYWRVIRPMERDYTVFVHIVDQNGNLVSGSDYLPRRFGYPTSYWRADQRVATGIIVPVEANLDADDYTIQVGLYHSPTMERLWIEDLTGMPFDDKVIVEPFSIVH